jgi:hypothetical protein
VLVVVGHRQSAPQAAPPVQLAHPGGSQSSVGATTPSPHWRSPGVPFLLQLCLQLVTTLRQSCRPAAYMILAAAMHRRFPSPVHAALCVWNATLNGSLHACPINLHCFVQGLAWAAGTPPPTRTIAMSARTTNSRPRW